ncbi:MAG: F0F1 ATP synthase subunit I [Pseudomonadales bacterium]|nr:F0F1 ATP synthase subunit I [Pseudomonadales bacterium]
MSNQGRPARVTNLKAPPIYKVIVTQFCTSITAAMACLVLVDRTAAYSVLLGGLISTVPNGYFARKAFKYRGARYTPEIVKSFYAGETGKMVMTAGLFALVFAGVRPLNEPAVVIGFTLTILAGLIATAFMNNASVRKHQER